MQVKMEQTTLETKVEKPHAYSCVGSPPTGSGNNSGEKKPTDIAREFHEKHVLESVADMRGQL